MSLKVAVLGVGHLGQHHARILNELPDTELVAVVDPDAERGPEIADKQGCAWFADPSQLPKDLDALTIAAPTTLHRKLAEPFLKTGLAVLVEKPIAHTMEDAEAMVALATDSGSILQIGHLERFNPAYQALKARGVQPGFVVTERLGVFSGRSLDVDVVMDLMIHDIDLLLDLMGEEPNKVDAVGVTVLTPKVDIASVRLRFPSGGAADLVASRISNVKVRKLRAFDQKNHLYGSVDFASQTLETVEVSMVNGKPELKRDAPKVPEVEPLKAELEHFLNCVRQGTRPEVPGQDGTRALKWAERVNQALADSQG